MKVINVKNICNKVMIHLDEYIFVKKGYSILKHLIPFSIASLIILITSLPENNLLNTLAQTFQQNKSVWLPALLLGITCFFVYFKTLNTQISKAYLWKTFILRRTILTSVTYISLCTAMTYFILKSNFSSITKLSDISACLLLSLLSLTGLGWLDQVLGLNLL